MAEGLFDPAELCPPGVGADTLRAAVVRILPRTPLHLDIAADRETAHKLARNELQDDGSEHWFRYFTDEDRARCDDPLFALGMVNHEFCQVVKRGDTFPASVMLDGGGTGVAVSAQGHVLTNFHLATGEIERLGRNGGVLDRQEVCRHLRVQWAQVDGAGGWHWVDAEAVHVVSNPPHAEAFRETGDARYRYRLHADVTLLRIEPAPSAWLPLSAQTPLIGAPVWMAGYPLRTARAAAARAAHGYRDADGSLRVSRGTVGAIGTDEADGERFIVTDLDGSAGNSGSPLFDAQGRVIGLFSRALGEGARNGIEYGHLRRIHVPTAMAVEALGKEVLRAS
jgi:S1-C subfamily serine protease